MSASLRFVDVTFRYESPPDNPVLDQVSFDLPRGGLAALIGPNGAGKTTLLSLACGTLRPTSGQVVLDGDDLARVPASRRARRIAVVPQSLSIPFAFTVRELVALGRTPYVHPLRGERPADHQAVERALALTDTLRFADRNVLDLSGGERQRVIVALALAQEPDLLLLDEPTANLDITHQLAILDLIRELNQVHGLTVLATVHDLNLASLGFERLIALGSGRVVADGSPRAVLTPDVIGAVYGSAVRVIDHPVESVPLVALIRTPTTADVSVPRRC